jgi:hypothetical protein
VNHSSSIKTLPCTTGKTAADQHVRRPFDGPVIADLAESSTPAVAALDIAWAAKVIAGYAYDAADLLSLLRILGIVDAPPRWRSP